MLVGCASALRAHPTEICRSDCPISSVGAPADRAPPLQAAPPCSMDGPSHCRAEGRFLAAVTYCVRPTGVVRYSRAYTMVIYVLTHE
jgi:hypothetical protein